MKSYFCKLILFLISASMVAISCKKNNDVPPDTNSANYAPGQIPGMGATDGDLTGRPFTFPSKIEIKGGIKGDIYLVPGKDYCQILGSGAFVLVQLELVNHLLKDTLLLLPAGLTFRSEDPGDQNGILIQETPINLLKDQTCKVLLYLYCANEHKNGSTKTSRYRFGPLTDAALLQELIQLLKNKAIGYDQLDPETYMTLKHRLQEAVWNITDRKGLTQDDRDYISSLDNLDED